MPSLFVYTYCVYIHISVGSALLVSTYMVMRRPRCVKRATMQGFTLFLYGNGFYKTKEQKEALLIMLVL